MDQRHGFGIYSIIFCFVVLCYFFADVAGFSTSMTATPLGNHTTSFVLSFETTEEPTCLFDYDDNVTESFSITGNSSDTTVTYSHDTNGFYDVYVYCVTDLNTSEDSALQTYVGDFLTGFEISNADEGVIQILAPLSADVDIKLRFDNGTDVTLTATLMQDVQEIIQENASVEIENVLTFSQSNFPGNGLYTVNATAMNPITATIERYAIIAIQDEINVTSVAINLGTNYVEVEKPFNIDLTFRSGEDVTISYLIYDETYFNSIDSLAFDCEGVLTPSFVHTHSYQFNVTGTFYVWVSVSNMVSFYTEIITVVSEHAVIADMLQLTITNEVSFYTDFISFSIASTAHMGNNVPAGFVSCVLDYGDTSDFKFSFNATTSTPPQVSSLQNRMYEAGFYKCILTCSNEIPTEFKIERDMRIENPVENIHLENSTDYVPMSVGITVFVKLDDPASGLPLYLITCTFEFGDGNAKTNVIGNITSTSHIELHYKYSRPGLFAITVNCSAELSHSVLALQVESYWDCWAPERFFDSFKTEDSPMVFFGHEILELKSQRHEIDRWMDLGFTSFSTVFQLYQDDAKKSAVVQILLTGAISLSQTCSNWTEFLQNIWTIYGRLRDSPDVVQYTTTTTLQSHNLPANTLNKGKYKLVLNSTFTNLEDAWLTDEIYLESQLPDLIPSIKGSTEQIVKVDQNVLVDASGSTDPAAGLSGVASTALVLQWQCKKNPALTDEDVSLFFASGNTDVSSVASDDCGLSLSSSDTTNFQTLPQHENIWHIFQFTMTRGGRTKSAFQAIKPVVGDPLNLGPLRCISNCHGKSASGLNKIELDTLQVAVDILDTDIVLEEVTYTWKFQKSDGVAFLDLSYQLTGTDNSGLSIPTGLLESGSKYRLSCNVKAPERRTTTVSEFYVVNMAPYGGDCTIDKTVGKASMELFCVECSGWLDENNREDRSGVDSQSGLTYVFIQYNEGALLSEIIHKSTSEMKFCMDLALPRNDTNTSVVTVKIKDRYLRPEASKSFTVTVLPYLDVSALSETGGTEGADQVTGFADAQATKMEAALATGDTEKLSSTIAAAMSSIASVNVQEPPTAIKVDIADDGGGLVDVVLDENGNVKVVTSDEMLKDFSSPPVVDPTTIAMQESCDKFTNLLISAMEKTILGNTTNATVSPIEVSQNSKAFLSVLSTDRKNLKSDTKKKIASNIERMSELIANRQVPPDNSDTHRTLRDITLTEGALVSSVVPPELKKVKPVKDMTSAAVLSDALYLLADPDQQALREQADLSPDERNFAMLKAQLKVKNEIRKTVATEEAQKAASAFTKLGDAIQSSVPQSNGHREIIGDVEDTITQTLTTNKGSKLAETPLQTNSSSIEISELGAYPEQSIAASITESKENVFMWDEKGDSSRVTSSVSRLKLIMNGTLEQAVKLGLNVEVPTYERRAPIVDPDDASELSYYITLVQSPDDLLCIAAKPTEDIVEKYEILINYGSNPTNIDRVAVGEASADNDWNVCFTKDQRPGRQIGVWHFGVRSFLKDEDPTSRKRREAGDPGTSNSSLPAFDLATATMACMTWNSETSSWESDSCEKSKWNPDAGLLECFCMPKNNEITFANSFYVPPNNIDFSTVFLKFSPLNQAAVMAMLILAFIVYILVLLWARRKDKKDLLKWGITPLADNFPEDCYFYVVKVYTGMRPGAGTKSKVAFVLSGDEMDTGVRELSDGVRKEFATGSILNFLLSTNSSLGQLEYMRLWHDNSGGGSDSSWYLSKIEVQDVQLNETFIFQAERWLAVEREDGALECVVPVSKRNDLNVFRNRFFQNAKDNLADNHVWLSVVYRPTSSSFTRVQRATCAFVFVMLTMIANAMFFRSEDNYETPAVVRVGPFRFSLQQIYISIICALISTPPTILCIYLFKMSKRNLPGHHEHLYRERRARKYTVPFWDDWRNNKLRESMELEQHLVAKGYPQMEGCQLPYWCNYIAWLLAFAAVFLSAFFIMLYSMQWGKQKSEEWLTTFLLSFFESVFFLDPIKVTMMALIFALIFRTAKDSAAMVERKTIMKQYCSSMRGKSCGMRLPAPPLDEKRLDEARHQRQKEIMMKSALTNVVLNLFICWILFSISYSNRDNRSYFLHRDVYKQILAPDGSPKFMDIKSINSFFDWLNKSAIPRLFPEENVNGERLHWRERQFMVGGASYRLGPPRLRQLRAKKDSCPIAGISSKDCYGMYYEPTEETAPYCIGWKTGECDPNEQIYKYSSAAWKFTSAFDIWGFPVTGYYTTYGGGGYIALLDVNRDVSQYILDELYINSWVDRQTRAVFLEFTLYCLNANLFMYNLFVVEFPETGGAFPYHILLPLRVYQHNGSTGVYTLVCEVIFALFLLVLTIQMIINIVQQKRQFFKKPWQVVDMITVILGYIAIIMYIGRFIMTTTAISKFKSDIKQFVNFYHIAFWDQMFVLLIGTLDFIITIRLLNILGYNKRIGAVARVFSTAASDLLWFGIFFVNMFTCYAVFGYLLFGSKLESYMNVYATMGTLFISMIGKSRFTEIDDTDPIMSKIYFMIFIFFVVYCILTMFLAVLSKSIEHVHGDLKTEKSEEMVEFLINKMKNMIGYGLGTKNTVAPRRGRPPAPWNLDSRRLSQMDNRSVLQAIRMSLYEALKESQETNQEEARKWGKRK